MKKACFVVLMMAASSCNRSPEELVDPAIARALEATKAIDNHAHPVRPIATGEAPDLGYDALPVESLEPSSDPVRFRPGRPEYAGATQFLFPEGRAAAVKAWGANYAATILDKAGIDRMVANRVAMGEGLPKERFLWSAYADTLMYPFATDGITANSDRKAFFALEVKLLGEYYKQSGLTERPSTLDDYLAKVVTPTIERHKQGGAVAEKFEMAYLRTLAVGDPSKDDAERAWRSAETNAADYRTLQDFLFRYIATESGRLGMAVHLHTGLGAGGYYDTAGANPGLLEPLLNDPALRKTNFVMVHGGWPFSKQLAPLLMKPNGFVDMSLQALVLPPSEVAATLQTWLELVPEKVLFGTDAYPYAPQANMGWEETTYLAAKAGRRALGLALTQMVRQGSVTQEHAIELGRMVLRENAIKLFGLRP